MPHVSVEMQNEWRLSNLKRQKKIPSNVENLLSVEYLQSVENHLNIENPWNASLEKDLRKESAFVRIFRVNNHTLF